MEWMPQAIRDGVIVVLVISGPLVLAAAFIGLIIGVLQAATQVQEQTIGSALKIIGVFGLIILAGFWMYQYLNNYTSRTLSTAFTFVPRQTQKAIPAQDSREEKFKESFEKEKVNIEAPQKPIRTVPQEEETLETKFPHGGPPVGIPYLGAPENIKPPDVSKLTPPTIPEAPKLPRTTIPLADFQEPKFVATPSIQSNTQTQVDTGVPIDTETINQQGQDTNPLLNLVPGNPTQLDDKAEFDPWLRKELFSENTDKETFKESQVESTETNEKPSWLN